MTTPGGLRNPASTARVVTDLDPVGLLEVPPTVAALVTSQPAPTPEQRHHAAAAIVAGYPHPPTIRESSVEAWCRPGDDLVNLPPRASFDSLDAFYPAAFHELGVLDRAPEPPRPRL